jgi:hypothetical protein
VSELLQSDSGPAIITGFLGLVAVIVTQRFARGAQREMTPAQTIAELASRLDRTEERLDDSLRRERMRDDYIHQLRDHISLGKAPPPPPWPEGLTT